MARNKRQKDTRKALVKALSTIGVPASKLEAVASKFMTALDQSGYRIATKDGMRYAPARFPTLPKWLL